MRRNLQVFFKVIFIAVTCMLVAAGWTIYSHQESQGKAFSKDYVRLHILANSDSDQDQQLKLKVRDAVVKYLTPFVKDVDKAEDAQSIIASHQSTIVQIAQKTLADNGVNYPVAVQMGVFDFPVRTYGTLVLPAGNYQAVRIMLGQAAGQNWWCVLFPPLCFIDGANTAIAPVSGVKEDALWQQKQSRVPEIRWKISELFNK